MAKVFYASHGGGNIMSSSTNIYIPISSNITTTSTEANAQMKFNKSGGTVSSAKVYISANSSAGDGAYVLRVNGADSAISISIPAGTTGEFSSSSTVTLSTDDLVNWKQDYGASARNVTIQYTTLTFEPDTFHYNYFNFTTFNTNTSTSRYCSIQGTGTASTTETDVKTNFKIAGTLEKMKVRVSTNNSTGPMTFRTRKNGSTNGNLSLTINTLSTGEFSDTTHSDTVSVDDDWSYECTRSTTSPATLANMQVAFTPDTSGQFQPLANVGAGGNYTNSTSYMPFGSICSPTNTTEVNAKMPVASPFLFSNLQAYVSANTGGSTVTITVMKDGSDDTQSLSISSSSTGWFEDTTNTTNIPTSSRVYFKVVGPTTGTTTIRSISAKVVPGTDPSSAFKGLMLMGVGT